LNKVSYTSSNPDTSREVQGPSADLVGKETATETGGRGFGTTEMTYFYDETDPDIYKLESEERIDSRPIGQDVMNLLVELGDGLAESGENSLANFADFLITKFAQAKDVGHSDLFNQLLMKINNADYLSNRNDIIKKLTKIYSRTIVLEYIKNQDLDKSKESAYKKILHRSEQYLSEGQMEVEFIKEAIGFPEDPKFVSKQIKNIIDIMLSRMSPESRLKSYPNLRGKITNFNAHEMSQKKHYGGSSIGSSISLVKNILNGRDPHFIKMVIEDLGRNL